MALTIIIALAATVALASTFIVISASRRSGKAKGYDVKSFYETYRYGLVQSPIGKDIFDRLTDTIVKGKRKVYLTDAEMAELSRAGEEYLSGERRLFKATELNNLGIEAEMVGDVGKAVSLYEQNILPGSYFTTHPYRRLCVIYRRQKRFEDEKRVIVSALARLEGRQNTKEWQYFAERLKKTAQRKIK
jgi:hypothetical protein